MKRFIIMLLFIAVGGGVPYLGLRYHFIVTPDGLVVAEKKALSFELTLVDTRKWGVSDYLANPEVTKILLGHGLRELLGGSKTDKAIDQAKDAIKDAVDDGGDELKKAAKEGQEKLKELVK